jgi:hypothetical protein
LKVSSEERFELSQPQRRSSKRRLASEHLQYDSNKLSKKELPEVTDDEVSDNSE